MYSCYVQFKSFWKKISVALRSRTQCTTQQLKFEKWMILWNERHKGLKRRRVRCIDSQIRNKKKGRRRNVRPNEYDWENTRRGKEQSTHNRQYQQHQQQQQLQKYIRITNVRIGEEQEYQWCINRESAPEHRLWMNGKKLFHYGIELCETSFYYCIGIHHTFTELHT